MRWSQQAPCVTVAAPRRPGTVATTPLSAVAELGVVSVVSLVPKLCLEAVRHW